MPWPTPQDYNEAIQAPRLAFTDQELRSGRAEADRFGLPRPVSGNFASVYRMHCGSRNWAARCFSAAITDHRERYEAIDQHLASVRLPCMVPFKYQPHGISVRGQQYPLVRMEWVTGQPLGVFIANNLSNAATLSALATQWMEMLNCLQTAGVSHGDLQHGNVLLASECLKLVDYDGMFVPALAGRNSNEVGHRNYQHPRRTNSDFGPYLDNFSGWVVYVALVALCDRPELWQKYNGGDECLLFRQADFIEPDKSLLFSELRQSANTSVRSLAQFLARLPGMAPKDVPVLDVRCATITIAPRSPLDGTGPNWWEDYVGAEEESAGGVGTGEAIPEPVRFKTSFGGVRIVAVGALAGLTAAGVAAGLPTFALAELSVGMLALLAVICFAQYRSDASLTDYRTFESGLVELRRQIEEQRYVRCQIDGERDAIVAGLTSAQAEWNRKRRHADQEEQSKLVDVQGRLDRAMEGLKQRRQSIVERQRGDVRAIHAEMGWRIADIAREIAALDQKEGEEKRRTLHVLQRSHIEARLRAYSIEGSSLHGLGQHYKWLLAASGIRTAADLSGGNHRSVAGIGPKRAWKLEQWRDKLKAEAAACGPKTLPKSESDRIENNFKRERDILHSTKLNLQTQFQLKTIETEHKYSQDIDILAQEERRLRQAADREAVDIRRGCLAKLATLDREFEALKRQKQIQLVECTAKARDVKTRLTMIQRQCQRKERESSKYAGLTYRNFLKAAVGI